MVKKRLNLKQSYSSMALVFTGVEISNYPQDKIKTLHTLDIIIFDFCFSVIFYHFTGVKNIGGIDSFVRMTAKNLTLVS